MTDWWHNALAASGLFVAFILILAVIVALDQHEKPLSPEEQAAARDKCFALGMRAFSIIDHRKGPVRVECQ